MRKIIAICFFYLLFATNSYAMDLSAEAACLIIADTGEIIYSKNGNTMLPCASTTKIMTGILAIESGDMDRVVEVSKNAEGQEGSSIYLKSGDRVKMRDLVYGLMLNSGNDSAVAIAEGVSGTVEEFAKKMTDKAYEIGAVNTSFKNPNGLDSEGHFTTAYDLAIIGAYAMKNEEFKKVVLTQSSIGKTEDGRELYFNNHNKLLKMYEGATGIKTGFTKKSGRCLVSAASRNGVKLVAVTLNAPDDWNDHMKMLDYGFENVENKLVIAEGQVMKTIIKDKKNYDFVAKKTVLIPQYKSKEIDIKISITDKLPTTTEKGEKIGCAYVFSDNKLVESIDIVSVQDIGGERRKNPKSYEKCFFRVLKSVV